MSNFQAHTLPDPLSGDFAVNLAPSPDHAEVAETEDKIEVSQVEQTTEPTEIDAINVIDAEFGDPATKSRSGRAARAGMEQNYLIPMDGDQDLVTKWEKYTFMVFREYPLSDSLRVSSRTSHDG
jgi:hypothetical protein